MRAMYVKAYVMEAFLVSLFGYSFRVSFTHCLDPVVGHLPGGLGPGCTGLQHRRREHKGTGSVSTAGIVRHAAPT